LGKKIQGTGLLNDFVGAKKRNDLFQNVLPGRLPDRQKPDF
jgi:hypothetical protein